MAKYKVKIEEDKCIGCGTCIALCPDNFKFKGDKAIVITEEVEDLDCISDAASSCPVQCIITKEQ